MCCFRPLVIEVAVAIAIANTRDQKKASFGKGQNRVHFLEILEHLENLVILESPQSVESKRQSDHCLEALEG